MFWMKYGIVQKRGESLILVVRDGHYFFSRRKALKYYEQLRLQHPYIPDKPGIEHFMVRYCRNISNWTYGNDWVNGFAD